MPESCCNKFALVFLTACYMCNSGLMLVSNKLAVHLFPHPIVLLIFQLATSWFVMFVLGFCVLDVDPCSWATLKKFWPVPFAWVAVLFAGMKAVQYANVETFIVFRATTPLVLCIAEWCFLGRQLPSCSSTLCLFLMFVASVGYTMTDSFFQITGYVWILVWYIVFLTEFVLVKHKVDTLGMTNWGLVYYTNGLSSIPLLLAAPTEIKGVLEFKWNMSTLAVVLLTCFLGVGMSFFSFAVRGKISATNFAIIGNACKIITVAINYVMWDLHASKEGLGYLALSLVAAFFYKQAPLRDPVGYAEVETDAPKEGELDAPLSNEDGDVETQKAAPVPYQSDDGFSDLSDGSDEADY